MPSLLIKTNVELDEEKKTELMKECSKSVSKLLRKPERFVLVSYETCSMIFGGKSDPCAYAYLASLGALGPTVNADVVKAISASLESIVGIVPNRVYIQFCDVTNRSDFGWNGTTFA